MNKPHDHYRQNNEGSEKFPHNSSNALVAHAWILLWITSGCARGPYLLAFPTCKASRTQCNDVRKGCQKIVVQLNWRSFPLHRHKPIQKTMKGVVLKQSRKPGHVRPANIYNIVLEYSEAWTLTREWGTKRSRKREESKAGILVGKVIQLPSCARHRLISPSLALTGLLSEAIPQSDSSPALMSRGSWVLFTTLYINTGSPTRIAQSKVAQSPPAWEPLRE
ncbi:hypothetical protein F5148DRAFT_1243485 [Russula earlei]|uniref:Uncharacterized protein n=1 Tax=Russula earlei TaxID=71964 RepID=A0ACC0TWQ8_9AGAM|nr:hypothetical protein F5148DRAFT_1243485 [Russula earlei]